MFGGWSSALNLPAYIHFLHLIDTSFIYFIALRHKCWRSVITHLILLFSAWLSNEILKIAKKISSQCQLVKIIENIFIILCGYITIFASGQCWKFYDDCLMCVGHTEICGVKRLCNTWEIKIRVWIHIYINVFITFAIIGYESKHSIKTQWK